MTWEIFLGIATLVGFVLSITGVVVKIVRTLTLMEANLKALSDAMQEEKAHCRALHTRVERLEAQTLRPSRRQ